MRRLLLVAVAVLVLAAQVSSPMKLVFLDEGVSIGFAGRLDCVGSTVACTRSGDTTTLTVSGVTTHNLLSTTHSDTTTGTVVRGDLIVGGSTPTWTRLAKGTAGQFLRMADSNDIGWGEASGEINTTCGSAAGFAPADATSYHMGRYAIFDCSTAYGTQSLFAGAARLIYRVDVRYICAPTCASAGNVAFAVRVNDTTDTSLGNQSWIASTETSFTGLSISLAAGDSYAIKFTTPTWATNPANVYIASLIHYRER